MGCAVTSELTGEVTDKEVTQSLSVIGRFGFESCHPDDAVRCEPVSTPNSLLTGKFQTRIREFFSTNREFPSADRWYLAAMPHRLEQITGPMFDILGCPLR